MSAEQKDEKVEIRFPSGVIFVEGVQCPNGCDLMEPEVLIHDHPSIAVRVSFGKKKGMIHLDPTYGGFENRYGIPIPDGRIIALHCPKCGVSLQEKEDLCQTCSTPLFVLHLPKGGIVEGCLRKGCFFHRLRIIDLDAQFVRLYRDALGGPDLFV